MARKKKAKKFTAVEAVKALARQRIGTPPAARVVPDKRTKQTRSKKHKPTLAKLLQEDS
jgi:hypothetical protein